MRKINNMIRHIAPTLASALGGPFAGVATKFIVEKLGGDLSDDGDHESILTKLLDSPENLLKIKELDHEFKTEMHKLNVDVFKLEVDDRKDARAMAMGKDNKPQILISIIFLGAYFLMLAGIFMVEASDTINMQKGENSLIGELQILFGVLTAGVGQILSFWFGGMGPFKEKSQ